jgi:hypothetical protein
MTTSDAAAGSPTTALPVDPTPGQSEEFARTNNG